LGSWCVLVGLCGCPSYVPSWEMVPLGYEDSIGRPLHWRFGLIVCHRRSDEPRQDNSSRADMAWVLQPCHSILPIPPHSRYALNISTNFITMDMPSPLYFKCTYVIEDFLCMRTGFRRTMTPCDLSCCRCWHKLKLTIILSLRRCGRKIRSHLPSQPSFEKVCTQKIGSISPPHPLVEMIHPPCTSCLKLEGFQLCPLSNLTPWPHILMNPYICILPLVSSWKLNKNGLWHLLFFKEDARKSWGIFRGFKETM